MDVQKLQNALVEGAWHDAEALLASVTETSDAHPSMLYNHGKVLMELAQMDQAVSLLRRAVRAAPGHAEAWFELGRAALALEDFGTAFEGFSNALNLTPGDTDARRNLGRVAIRLGEYTTARAVWLPLRGDAEADLALYRVAAETRDPAAANKRQALLDKHPNKAAVIKTLVRVSKGSIPLSL